MNDEFESIAERAGYIIGEQEIEARKVLGDEEYDKMAAFAETQNRLVLSQMSNNANFIASLATLASASAFVLWTLPFFASAWTIFYWVN